MNAEVAIESECSHLLGGIEDEVFAQEAHVLGRVTVVELHDLRGVGLGNHPGF